MVKAVLFSLLVQSSNTTGTARKPVMDSISKFVYIHDKLPKLFPFQLSKFH